MPVYRVPTPRGTANDDLDPIDSAGFYHTTKAGLETSLLYEMESVLSLLPICFTGIFPSTLMREVNNMFRDLLSSRWFQGGFAFFVLCVWGSLLYSWHVHRTTEAELGKKPLAVESLKNKQATSTAPVDFQTEGVVNTPDENADTPIPDATEADTIDATEFAELADAFLPDDLVSEETPAEEVAVSPFGFGPYPEVPADYFREPIWMRDGDIHPNDVHRDIELIDRVLIKLWTQGDRGFVGASTHNGKIYPHYPDTLYVRWTEKVTPDGFPYRYISRVKGASNAPHGDQLNRDGIPPHFKVIDLDEGGIDPYQFLNLTQGDQ